MTKIGLLGATMVSAMLLGACSQGNVTNIPVDALLHDEAFVQIEKSDGDKVSIGLVHPSVGINEPGRGDDFYLAVAKKELGKKWFLSAYLKQYFPGAVNMGAVVVSGT